ncbi:hypothetical protein OAA90_04580 [Salibacteraceae bacterium]|nr:hypothetical protein [Salibacteraceae bacterium]MDB9725636.1 hypothetical protein [Salibacteraceae bacterium]MDC1204009.1 hypothetical protein [Salibacteraceae bacterium]
MKTSLFWMLILGISCSLLSCKKVLCKGIAKPNCAHTLEYAPVCGCDGITYSNQGAASCNSINDFTEGACD